MRVTQEVEKILSYYESDNPGTKKNLASILMQGKLAGTGKLIILPVDQGFEHGPARSFASNPAAYDPHYHYKLAIEAGLSAYAAPLGMLEAGASSFAGAIPTILKINSANSLAPKDSSPYQAITGSVKDALRLGCAGVGFTIYPGSENAYYMMDEIREIAQEAKSVGLVVVIWSYARGADLSKDDETSVDVISYSAHIAALMGAHIIKVKPPTELIASKEAEKVYLNENIAIDTLEKRISHVKQACFAGRRLVVFSGGVNKSLEDLYAEVRSIKDGGGDGSIIGRNSFQRPKDEAMKMLNQLIEIYKS